MKEPRSLDEIPGEEKMLRKEDIEYPDLTSLEVRVSFSVNLSRIVLTSNSQDTEIPDIGSNRKSIAIIKKWSAKLQNVQRMSRELSRYHLTCMLPLCHDAASSKKFPTNEARQRTAVDSLMHLAVSE